MEVVKESATTEKISSRSMARRVVSNFSWLVVSEAIGKGIFFLTNIYLARTLGVESFGLFTLGQTIIFHLWLAVDLGTGMYGIREIAKHKSNAEEITSPLLTMRITGGLLIFFSYTIILGFLEIPTLQKATFFGCSFYLLTYSFYPDWVFKGLEKFQYIAWGSFVSSLLFLIGVMHFVRSSNDAGIASSVWSWSYLFGSLSLLFFLHKRLRIKYRPSFNFRIWLLHLRESVFFAISGGLIVLYHYAPILLLSFFFTNYEVGIFSAPFRLILTIGTAGFVLPSAFYPVFSELHSKETRKFAVARNKLQNVSIFVGLAVGLLGAVFGYKIIQFLYGDQYLESVFIFRILIWIVPLYFLRNSYRIILLSEGYQKSQNLAFLIGVFAVLTIGFIVIPKGGCGGAVVSLIGAEGLILITMILLFKYRVRLSNERGTS
jgi:PST family polysaccharide transporter